MTNEAPARVAVYWDLENIHWTLFNVLKERGSAPDRFSDLINMGAVMDYAESFGRVVLNQAYANWSRLGRYQWQVVKHNMDCVQVFPTVGMKNAGDIKLAMDVVRDLREIPSLTHVILISGDSDFLPLITEVRKYGVEVINVALEQYSSAYLKQRCDYSTTYESLTKGSSEPIVLTTPPSVDTGLSLKTLDIVSALPREAKYSLSQRRKLRGQILRTAIFQALVEGGGDAVEASVLRNRIASILVDFNEAAYLVESLPSHMSKVSWLACDERSFCSLTDPVPPVSEIYKVGYYSALELMGFERFITRHVYAALNSAYDGGLRSMNEAEWEEKLASLLQASRGDAATIVARDALRLVRLAGFIEDGVVKLPEDPQSLFLNALREGRSMVSALFQEVNAGFFAQIFIPQEEHDKYGERLEEALGMGALSPVHVEVSRELES